MPKITTPLLAALFLIAAAGNSLAQSADATDLHDSSLGKHSKVDWVKTYRNAREIGTDSHRPVFLFVTSEACTYCRKMEQESLEEQAIVSKLQTSFVPTRLKLDPESQLAKDLKITMFPTTVIIAPDGRIVDYVRGYMDRQKLSNCIRKALKSDVAMRDAKQSR